MTKNKLQNINTGSLNKVKPVQFINKIKELSRSLILAFGNSNNLNKNNSKKLLELSAVLNSSLSIEIIKELAINNITNFFDSEAGSLFFIDNNKKELYFDVATGDKGKTIKTMRLPIGSGIAGRVAQTKEALISNDVENDPRFFQDADKKSGFLTKNMMCVPIEVKDELLGVLQIMNKTNGNYTTYDLENLEGFANNIGMAILNSKTHQELQETHEKLQETTIQTLNSLAQAISSRDKHTQHHANRVTIFALKIGLKLGLEQNRIILLERAARLHDIGKIGIPDAILLKPGGLSDEEFAYIKKHTIIGEEIIKFIDLLKQVAPIIRSHHERPNGNGYPDKLKNDEIPLESKIISVADVFDALMSKRSYKNKLSLDQTINILIEEKEKLNLDGNIVDILIDIITNESLEEILGPNLFD